MQPGNPMVGGGSVFLVQAATTPKSDSFGSQWPGDYCKMLISSSERGHGSGAEGEEFLLFVAILFSLSFPRRRREVCRLPAPPALSAASSACRACCSGEGPCQLCAFKVMAKAALAEKGIGQAIPGPSGEEDQGGNLGFPVTGPQKLTVQWRNYTRNDLV